MNYFLRPGQLRKGQTLNVFGEIEEDLDVTPPAPCVTIAVTDEIRKQDEAALAARERATASAWTIKASLSKANLRTARREVVPRINPRPRKPAREPKPAKPQKSNRTTKELAMPKSSIPVFKTLAPVATSTITHLEAGHGPRNVFQTLFTDLCACDAEHALPITFSQEADGILVCKRVGFIAGHKGKKVNSRRSEDGLTFYLWVTDKAA